MSGKSVARLAIVAVVAFVLCAAASVTARACIDCWPVYYEPLYAKPSNWVTVGNYDPGAGDTVWVNSYIGPNGSIVTNRWYVLPGDAPNPTVQPHACCPVGPYYISGDGGTLLLY